MKHASKMLTATWGLAVCTVFVGLIWIAGCQRSAPSAEDQELARETLISALDAWKSGQLKILSQRKPPIRFVDEDSAAGFQLTDYEFEQPDAPIVSYHNIKVSLEVRDRHGLTSSKTATYQVGIEPNLSVLRADN